MNNAEDPERPPERKAWPWWLYALTGLGGFLIFLVVLVVILVVVGLSYGRSLINTYTTSVPRPLPKVQQAAPVTQQFQKEMENKWTEFAKAVLNRQKPPPFRISADDLNRFLSGNKGVRDNLHFVITNNQLQAEFCVPLDQTGFKPLKGRYLNGVAGLNIVFQDGWLTVSVGKVEANGQPVPGWMLRKLRGQNLTKDLDQNREVVTLFQEIESIEVRDGLIVITPAN